MTLETSLALSGAVQLGERDEALLADILTYGAMLGCHIHALFFPGRSRRRMNQRLQQLVQAGLITRRPMPLGLSAGLPLSASPSGIPHVYSLGAKAAPLVASRLGWDVSDVRRLVRQGTPTALAHTLQIVHLRLQAEQAIREHDAQFAAAPLTLEFLPERLLRHSYQVRALGGTWRDEVFKPDALIKLAGAGEQRQHFFVEVDLGHTSSAEWAKKADITTRYRHASLFPKRYGALTFKTLVVTTGDRRRGHLNHLLLRQLCSEDAACFGVTTFIDAATQGLLAPVWHVPGQDAPTSLHTWDKALGAEEHP